MIKIKRGLDLPIVGAPKQVIEDGPTIRTVAVLGGDYVGMKPTMRVAEGDSVKKGQVLFEDKKTTGVVYTAPAAGRVSAIHRGHKRVLQSVVIDVEGDEEEVFSEYSPTSLGSLGREKVEQNLVASGLWTAFRTRPFSKVPTLGVEPYAIFVNAMDTNPLGLDPQTVVAEQAEAFQQGLDVIGNLTSGKVYLCKAEGARIGGNGVVSEQTFAGPHPAGLSGTHIHFLAPVSAGRTVWTIGYQDVIAIGKLFTTGRLYTDRVVALAGPSVSNPRLIRTRLGACTDELVAGQLNPGDNRVISGSVLTGHKAHGPYAFLGRFHNQVSVLPEGNERGFMEYLWAGREKHSVMNIYLSKLSPGRRLPFNTSTNGSPRGMVPIGAYEEVMPLDILPTQLLRALIVGDTEVAQQLGCLELDEEDVALCTYVCPGKYEYGPILRDNLTRIEKEG